MGQAVYTLELQANTHALNPHPAAVVTSSSHNRAYERYDSLVDDTGTKLADPEFIGFGATSTFTEDESFVVRRMGHEGTGRERLCGRKSSLAA